MPEKSVITLDPHLPVVLAGSCFSQNMASKMKAHLWKAVNPLGTLYNPVSICQALDIMLDEKEGSNRFENSLFHHNGIWNSCKFDSSFSSQDKNDCIEDFENKGIILRDALQEGRQLIVTFGTSFVYYFSDTGEAVGNCHKLPSQRFFRERLSVTEISATWKGMIEKLNVLYPEIKIIFTVSPVRHLKDGFVGNMRSKAVLSLGIESIVRENPGCQYFPAYEILNDDLRDYRFYASDLAHPSEEAIEYVWGKFLDTFVDKQGIQILTEGASKYKAERHRPKTGALGKPIEKGIHP